MSIPNRPRTENEIAPPPLPPPRYVPVDGPQLDSSRQPPRDHFDGDFKLNGRRGFESPGHSLDIDGPNYMRRESVKSIKDEGYHSLASTESLPKKLFMSHDQYRPRDNNDYDNSLLKKFSAQPPRRSALSSSVNDALPRFGSENQQSLLPHLSLPIRISNNLAMEDGSMQSAISPRGLPFSGASSNDYRSPIEPADSDRSPLFRSRRTNSGSLPDDATISTQGSYDNMDDDFPMEETSGIKRLHIDDTSRSEYQRMGLKRRASSPPGDDLIMQSLPSSGELLRRREGGSRQSPTPRLTVIPQGSISSVSSVGRSGSFASNISLTATSLTSGNSFGRVSPNGLSPVDGICNSPFSTPISLTHSPSSSISRIPHHRNLSDNRPLASPRKLSDVSKTTMSRIQGFFMCECCPKKPKKFETAEELSAHAAEKQYECSFCGNRFKNKNEAERHQNSLHVRRHSWSCSALHVAGYDKAFHESSNRPGEADACGYCGDEFTRSGGSGRNRHATEQDWDERLRHLQEVHKFRECNSSKKFFRADHFRQHLKHSHAGTSGKWTNMLESACMIEEEPPQPR
ncbi:C2H2 finger domain-containingprotein [Apiospora saccharicola]|uniref:C2H2 finger domain-containingprotein n=1 Tax=Apiospora saccharicola TaxID=335842 RepID=A0ABR1W2D9_9PEZI